MSQYNTVGLYHEFLNQMESCMFNDNLIDLSSSCSDNSNSIQEANNIRSNPISPNNTSIKGHSPNNDLNHATYSSNKPIFHDNPVKTCEDNSIRHPHLHSNNSNSCNSHSSVNLNLDLNINDHYDKLAGLISHQNSNHTTNLISKSYDNDKNNDSDKSDVNNGKPNILCLQNPFNVLFNSNHYSLKKNLCYNYTPSSSSILGPSSHANNPMIKQPTSNYNNGLFPSMPTPALLSRGLSCDELTETFESNRFDTSSVNSGLSVNFEIPEIDDDDDDDDDYEGDYYDESNNNDDDDDLNLVCPGLFPSMNVNDCNQFMSLDMLPLNPSYVTNVDHIRPCK